LHRSTVGRAARPDARVPSPYASRCARLHHGSQIAEEVLKINDQILSIYSDFGFDDVRI